MNMQSSALEKTNSKPVLWLTGASSGIGAAVAREAARRGYALGLTARRVELLEQVKNDCIKNGLADSDIVIAAADVTNAEQVRQAYDLVKQRFGFVDIVVANAGAHNPGQGDFRVQDVRNLFELNFFGALNCIEVAFSDMATRRKGHIVGVSSVAGYRALPTAAAYGASKSALTHFLESLRFDAEPLGIHVSVVSPGFVKTPLTDKNDFPMPCLIEPEVAAREIMNGIERKSYEIHFPKRFSYFLKALQFLPGTWYHALISRTVKT